MLDRAAGGAGGLLTFVGASGSGKTALAEAAADEARRRGFEVLRGSPPSGQLCPVPVAAFIGASSSIVIPAYWICTPEMARATTSRWISEVPSKILVSRASRQ